MDYMIEEFKLTDHPEKCETVQNTMNHKAISSNGLALCPCLSNVFLCAKHYFTPTTNTLRDDPLTNFTRSPTCYCINKMLAPVVCVK